MKNIVITESKTDSNLKIFDKKLYYSDNNLYSKTLLTTPINIDIVIEEHFDGLMSGDVFRVNKDKGDYTKFDDCKISHKNNGIIYKIIASSQKAIYSKNKNVLSIHSNRLKNLVKKLNKIDDWENEFVSEFIENYNKITFK